MKCQFIAEIGVNHECSLERAARLIQAASRAGADVVKFQTYKAEYLAHKESPAYWDLNSEPATSQHSLFSKFDRFGVSEFTYLSRVASENNVEFMSTPFDVHSVRMLDPLVKRFKVASADITNYELLDAVTASGKPIILSTGASTADEVEEAVKFVRQRSDAGLTLLHCTLNYPTLTQGVHLTGIKDLASMFPDISIGFSDHSVPTDDCLVQLAAVLMGAVVLEKHFTDDKTATGNDHYHAFDAKDLANFKQNLLRLKAMTAPLDWSNRSGEEQARKYARRSLAVARNVKCGDRLAKEDIMSLRPATGIPAKLFFDCVGKIATKDLVKGNFLEERDLK